MDKRRTYLLFAIVTIGCALGGLTQTVMNSMLGGVQQSFGTDENVSQWLTTAYMLTIGVTVPLVTHLSRRFTVRQLTLASFALVGIGAIIAGLAPVFGVLLFARIVQAAGTGVLLPMLQTIAMTRFPKGRNATAMGIAGIALGFAPNIGPLIGGALVGSLGWRSFYWMLLAAVGLLSILTIVLVRRNDREMENARLDFVSFLLSTLGFGGLLVAFSNAAGMPFGSAVVLLPLGLGLICLGAFVVRQRRVETPLITMDIFRSKTYVVSYVAQNLLYGSFMGITLILPLFVINVMGLSAVDAGMVFLPNTILAVVFNPLAGILSDKIGVRKVVVFAAVMLALGAVPQAFMDAGTPFWLLVTCQAVRGIGVSSLIGPLNSWGMGKLPFRNMVDGSAFFNTSRQASASLCTAVMMMIISGMGTSVIGGATVAADALGYQLALGFSALLAVGVLVCAVFFVRDLHD